jgi:hypothetical protein
MSTNDLERRVTGLATEIDGLLNYFEIMNVQSAYNHYLDTGGVRKIATEIIAQKDPEVRTDLAGIYEGIESVKRLWDGMANAVMSAAGVLGTVANSTPYIEVSQDGRTAKGLWHGFGPNSFPCAPYPGDEEKLTAFWIMVKYVIDFVKEDGQWRFRTYQLELYFRTPFEQGWIKQPDARRFLVPPWAQPDKPEASFKPYHPHEFNQFRPVPEPEL